MGNTRNSPVSIILAGVFASGLLFAAIFSGQAYAIITIIDDNVVACRGWDMGFCRIPYGTTSTAGVYFRDGEIINMPLHINNYNDSPDVRDIWITGSPVFMESVKIGESRYTSDGNDKYAAVMSCFLGGIDFDVPDSGINDEEAVQSTIDRYRDSTIAAYRYTPAAYAGYSPAVQLEFYVSGGVGYVKISNNCRIKTTTPGLYDYCVVPGYSGILFQKYNIYAYHFRPATGTIAVPIESTYVTQTFGGYTSDPGGQIYVNGNVVIGSCGYNDMIVKGKITVVATGNIWIADSIRVDGDHDINDMPANDNPNFLGLIAQGVIKIVDPGKSPSSTPAAPSGTTFARVCNGSSPTSNSRYLSDPTIIEAAMTIGGGGFGAENVDSSGGRKAHSPPTDDLYVHGAIAEILRGVVGLFNASTGIGINGYSKYYCYDERLSPVAIGCSEAIPGDLNRDCAVDFEDVAIMAVHWLENNLSGDDPPTCISPIKGDLNNDCSVDFLDFAILAGHWLQCNLELE